MRSSLIPVVLVDDRRLFDTPTLVPDYLNASYLDQIPNLEIQESYPLQAGDVPYPELLSERKYGTNEYWWILATYNGCIEPITDMKVGDIWLIPTIASIQAMVNNKVGSRASRIGSKVTLT